MSVRFLVAQSLERILGRRTLVRCSRFLLDYARLDVPNAMESNGELDVQDAVVRQATARPFVAFDVGASTGMWSRHLLARLLRHDVAPALIYAFEPSTVASARFAENVVSHGSAAVVCERIGLSNRSGQAALYGASRGAGSSSLHGVCGTVEGLVSEAIALTTLDQYAAAHGLTRIDLVKVDAEGHDACVIAGGIGLYTDHAISVTQFEYNHRWIGARSYLKDVFDQLLPLGYAIGKVTPRGIEWYDVWDPTLETFREANYLAVLPRWRHHFVPVEWWLARQTSSG